MPNSTGVICLLHRAGIEVALSKAGCVNEVVQGKEVTDEGLARCEAYLSQACLGQLMLLRPINKPLVENDSIQPMHCPWQGLTK